MWCVSFAWCSFALVRKTTLFATILEGLLPILFFWDYLQSLRNTIRKSNGKMKVGYLLKLLKDERVCSKACAVIHERSSI